VSTEMIVSKRFTENGRRTAADRRGRRPVPGRWSALVLVLAAACALPGRPAGLRDVRAWAMQLQGFEEPGAVRRLADSAYGMVVVDAPDSVRGSEEFDTAGMVASLKDRRLCLAYVNVGQAENYRTYWKPSWKPPAEGRAGDPSFLVTVDPDGWEGDFPVAYWDPRWRALVLRRVERMARLGFDGVYADWVLGFEEPAVEAAARRAGRDPAKEMAELLRSVKQAQPGLLLVLQNGGALLRSQPELRAWVDGYAQECVSYRGEAGAAWDDPAAADIPLPATGDWSTESLLKQLQFVRGLGLPVFTVDYAAKPANAARARERARRVMAVPFVSRAPLDRLP